MSSNTGNSDLSSLSQPSPSSSKRLSSRASAPFVERGESSSSATRTNSLRRDGDESFSDGRREGEKVDNSPKDGNVGDHLRVERHRPKRSGGFLLAPNFPSAGGSRHGSTRQRSGHGKDRERDEGDHIGLRRGGPDHLSPSRIGDTQGTVRENRSSNPIQSSSQRNQPNPSAQIKAYYSTERHPQMRYISEPAHAHSKQRDAQPGGAINPRELVDMALTLSESRRRNLSAGHIIAQPVAGEGRVPSVAMPSGAVNLHGSFRDYTPGSLKHHLQQQRRISRNISPKTPNRRVSASPHVYGQAHLTEPAVALQQELTFDLPFSAATLARAKKARAHIELSYEFRRLLDHLPPLRPELEGTVLKADSVPGSSNVHISRVSSHTDPDERPRRSYNPLQAIRNRRVRARERQILDPDVDDWSDVDKVRKWVDKAASQLDGDDYSAIGAIMLPPFEDWAPGQDGQEHPTIANPVKPPSLAKPKRPRMDWFIGPSELLADMYWLEQDDHRSLIEDRNGHRFSTSRFLSTQYRPRSSREDQRGGESLSRVTTGLSYSGVQRAAAAAEDSESESDRGRRRIPFLRGNRSPSISHSRKPTRHKVSKRSRSSSFSSGPEGTNYRRNRHKRNDTSGHAENIGPLQLHMNELLRNQRILDVTTPADDSPDKWGFTDGLSKKQPFGGEEAVYSNGKALRGTEERGRKRSSLILSLSNSKDPRSSFEDLDSTAANSPVNQTFAPNPASELSLPTSRRNSPSRKAKIAKLLPFRLDIPKAPDDTDHDYATADETEGKALGKQHSGLSEPERFKSRVGGNQISEILVSSKNEVVKVPSSGQRSRKHEREHSKDERADTKSAVSRFFRGARIGELVRPKMGEILGKKENVRNESDSTGSDEASDISDTDERPTVQTLKRRPKNIPHSSYGEIEGSFSRSGESIDYLPSFRSSLTTSDRGTNSRHLSKEEDGTDRQDKAFENVISPRGSLLGVTSPRNNKVKLRSSPLSRTQTTTNDSRQSSRDREAQSSRSRSISAIRGISKRLHQVSTERDDDRKTAAATSVSGEKDDGESAFSENVKQRRPEVNRHWSISDEPGAQRHTDSTVADYSRALVRATALLLSSGIKAKEISRRSYGPREPPPAFLTAAFAISKSSPFAVPQREEHKVAGRLLTSELELALSALGDIPRRFAKDQSEVSSSADSDTASGALLLHRRLESLRNLLTNSLEPRVHQCTAAVDEALDDLSGPRRIALREVSDAVDAMIRARRRRLRWVRRFSFLLLEWLLLGMMWWVWLIVVVIRLIRGVFMSLITAFRWFLWL